MQFGSNGSVKILHWGKDGGPQSKVWGFWFVGIKRWFSLVLLRFDDGSREAFHSHAFDCVSWVIRGQLEEVHLDDLPELHRTGAIIVTRRNTFHKVYSFGRTWVFTLRGPWKETWNEVDETGRFRVLTHGRKELA